MNLLPLPKKLVAEAILRTATEETVILNGDRRDTRDETY
jgi:hypothetical protein